jgi:hypothetical protein
VELFTPLADTIIEFSQAAELWVFQAEHYHVTFLLLLAAVAVDTAQVVQVVFFL